jgi:putative transferase (TIGR04331 family)
MCGHPAVGNAQPKLTIFVSRPGEIKSLFAVDLEAWESSHWADAENRESDFALIASVSPAVVTWVGEAVNSLCNLTYGRRFYRFLLTSWVVRYLVSTLDLWRTAEALEAEFGLEAVRYLRCSEEAPAPAKGLEDFDSLRQSNQWRASVLGKIISSRSICSGRISFCDTPSSIIREKVDQKKSFDFVGIAKSLLSFPLATSRKVLVFNSYLPKGKALSLLLRLWSLPFFPYLGRRSEGNLELPLRRRLFDSAQFGQEIPSENLQFVNFALKELENHIPIPWLEGLAIRSDRKRKSRVKVVFTSNAFRVDESVRVGLAEQIDQGARLVIGQHGGNYGLMRFHQEHWIEQEMADYFLSWGWSVEGSNVIPGGRIRNYGVKLRENPLGGALLILTEPGENIAHLAAAPAGFHERELYLRDQLEFLKGLNPTILSQTIVKEPQHFKDHARQQRWREACPTVSFSSGETLVRPVEASRVAIVGYDGTSLLELLANNVPTVFFWDVTRTLWNPRAEELLAECQEVGLFHPNPESAALFVNEHFGVLELWWDSAAVRRVVQRFVQNFALDIPNLPKYLAALLADLENP